MTVVLDAPLVSTMAEPTADASGFVFDASSGLYYHASSGFYYDAKAGWYYNTQDGQYYVYENDQYVPLATTTSDEAALGAVGDEVNQTLIQSADDAPNHEEGIREEATIVEKTLSPSGTPGLAADQDAVVHETPSQIVEDSSTTDVANSEWQHTTDVANSEWQHTTDVANSEWQHTTDAANSHWQPTSDAANSHWQPTTDVAKSEWQDASSGYMQSVAETPPGLYPGTEMSSLSMGTVPEKKPDEPLEGEPEETRPASVWIAETLTELYGQSAYEASTQPAYANPSSQQSYYEEEPVPMGTYMTWQEAQEHYRRQWGNAVAYNDPYEVRGAYGTPHYGGRS